MNKGDLILIQDGFSKGFTAFFSGRPDVVAEGDSLQDARNNLLHLIKDITKQ